MEDTPPVAPTSSVPPVAAPVVTDRRPSPRGVLPRGAQTWLLAGLAAFMLLIMFVVGRPEPPARPAAASAPAAAPTADRVREYQDRLRALESQTLAQATEPPTIAGVEPRAYSEPTPPPAADPVQADRRRREYESLFASNVVLSRRPEPQRPDAGRSDMSMRGGVATGEGTPTVDEIADAAVRATTRAAGLTQMESQVRSASSVQQLDEAHPRPPSERPGIRAPTGPISAAGPLHRV